MSSYGTEINVNIFGESHGDGVGVVLSGIPAGEEIDLTQLSAFLARRAPGKSSLTTKRQESDLPQLLSGMLEGKSTGAPISVFIKNEDARSSDYQPDIPRPGHADYPAFVKYKGYNDYRGGGQFSGRLTAPLCVAGGILIQFLERRGIFVQSHIFSVKNEFDEPFDDGNNQIVFDDDTFPVISPTAKTRMQSVIADAASRSDSVGGVVECKISGVPAGYGGPMFDGIENKISSAVFAIGGVKGIEFGNGFACTSLFGSENNDPFRIRDGLVVTESNNHGGILGGITSGMPIIFRVAIKPTPSIGITQRSVNLKTMQNAVLTVSGRHDPCIVSRVAPCIEAAAALAISDIVVNK